MKRQTEVERFGKQLQEKSEVISKSLKEDADKRQKERKQPIYELRRIRKWMQFFGIMLILKIVVDFIGSSIQAAGGF